LETESSPLPDSVEKVQGKVPNSARIRPTSAKSVFLGVFESPSTSSSSSSSCSSSSFSTCSSSSSTSVLFGLFSGEELGVCYPWSHSLPRGLAPLRRGGGWSSSMGVFAPKARWIGCCSAYQNALGWVVFGVPKRAGLLVPGPRSLAPPRASQRGALSLGPSSRFAARRPADTAGLGGGRHRLERTAAVPPGGRAVHQPCPQPLLRPAHRWGTQGAAQAMGFYPPRRSPHLTRTHPSTARGCDGPPSQRAAQAASISIQRAR
jgi:hypothetical protein